jgi:hypothetical protein
MFRVFFDRQRHPNRKVIRVDTGRNRADIQTKVLARVEFEKKRDFINVKDFADFTEFPEAPSQKRID